MKKILIVGSGLSGSALARTFAENELEVDVIDRRNHIGGNAYDYENDENERIHKYGPHILHGSHHSIGVKWLSKFTEWIYYNHKVRALLENNKTTPLPINITTLEDVFKVKLETVDEAKELLNNIRSQSKIKNAKDYYLNKFGKELTDLFFLPYSKKMWGLNLEDINIETAKRLGIRLNRDDRYFTDTFQALPKLGYTNLLNNIYDHSNIGIKLNTEFDFEMIKNYSHVFITGPIDEIYNYRYGKLPYRSIKFEHKKSNDSQSVAVINFTHQSKYTRKTQWNIFPNSYHNLLLSNSVTYEIPCDPIENNNEKYYPINNNKSITLYKKYVSYSAKNYSNITFCGRCGLFKYLDMIPAVELHLQLAKKHIKAIK